MKERKQVELVLDKYQLAYHSEQLDIMLEKPQAKIGFLGEFSSGKSSLINALTDSTILPTSTDPCTSRVTYIEAIQKDQEPSFFKLDNEELQCIDKGTFDDIAKGLLDGKILARIPERKGFVDGFSFVDTPGIGSFNEEHKVVTFEEIPFLDASVFCIDIQKGNVNQSILSFLEQPIIRHLHSRFIFALTHSDQLSPTAVDKIKSKTIKQISKHFKISEQDMEKRVCAVSSTQENGTVRLQNALEDIFVLRKSSLIESQKLKLLKILVPKIIATLQQKIQAYQEPESSFEKRIQELQKECADIDVERDKSYQSLEKFKQDLHEEVKNICNGYKHKLAAITDEKQLSAQTVALSEEISTAIQNRIDRFTTNHKFNNGNIGSELQSSLNNINKFAGISKTVVTATITSLVLPGSGVAGQAAEAGAGAIVQKGAEEVAKKAAKEAAKKMAFKAFLAGVAKVMDEINPVNVAGDFLAEQVKVRQLDDLLRSICDKSVYNAHKFLYDYFENEIFSEYENELQTLQVMLEEVREERKKDVFEKDEKIKEITNDINTLRLLL